MQFADLRLAEPILRSISEEGYSTATPIQAQSIPLVLEGRDLVGCAQTGTGKTAAFALPILDRLSKKQQAPAMSHRFRALILCPTRELASQIGESFATYGRHLKLKHTVIFGGVGQNPQVSAIRRGVDVLIATPGRLLDLMEQRMVDLRGVEVLVLDEADRMLDMGFIQPIRRIVNSVPRERQTLLFSATMPEEIRQLASDFLTDPAKVQVAPVSATADRIDQSVYFVDKRNKPQLLAHLFHNLPIARGVVFTRTKHGADKVVRNLHARGIRAEAIHGNKAQSARERALQGFKTGKLPLLVATDIASRGIDVDGITHVVNYDLTHEPEVYVHRIGRTARAGASGCSVSFCDHEERAHLRAIEKLIRKQIPVRDDHPEYVEREALPQRTGSASAHAAEPRRQHASNRHDNASSQRRQGQSTQRDGQGQRHAAPAGHPNVSYQFHRGPSRGGPAAGTAPRGAGLGARHRKPGRNRFRGAAK